MKAFLHHLRFAPLVVIVWVVLEEELSVRTVIVGAVVGMLTLAIVDRYVLLGDYERRYALGPVRAVRYAAALLVQIYVAGFQALHRLVTGRVNVDIVDITTELEDDFRVSLLANSITLTPGTVTLERRGGHLRVIWLDCVSRDPEVAGPMIKGGFERMLRGGQR